MTTEATEFRRLDVRGLRCPIPVLRVEAALRRVTAGTAMIVVADDPVAVVDIPHFCAEAGHSVERMADQDGACVFRVTRVRNP